MLDAIAKAFQEGGEFMYFITLASAFASAVVLERAWVLVVRYRADLDRIGESLTRLFKSGQAGKDDLDVVESQAASPVARMALAALQNDRQDTRTVKDRVQETYLSIVPEVQVRTSYLNMLANVATLLGLLGTIIGLIEAFAGVAAADPSRKQALLASGIAIAMNTTAYGLMVAIPCMVSYTVLSARMNNIMAQVEAVRSRIQSWLAARSAQAA
jgi:biopolymer transport protein ExbB/TolQ